ncbi:MAG: hypothetical protein K2X32_05345, partial [Phycisphaerales bacterium]|nr:hypothetical protein [Phycisphaerales bacterium]
MSTPPFATGTTTTNARSLGRDGQEGRPSAEIAVPGVATVELGDGKDYRDRERELALPLQE